MHARTAAVFVAFVFLGLAVPTHGQGVPESSVPEVLPPLLPQGPGGGMTPEEIANSEPWVSIVRPSEHAPPGMPGPADDPYARLVHGIAAKPDLSDLELQWSIQDYYHEMGFDVVASPQAGGTTFTEFDPNSTYTFTYELGDVNGDGYDDIAYNMYCVAYSCRAPSGGGYSSVPPQIVDAEGWCGTPHRLFALNGYNGSVLWEATFSKDRTQINTPVWPGLGNYLGDQLFSDCGMEFVVGTVPDRAVNRSALLMYRYAGGPGVDTIFHQYRLLDPATGEELWSWSESGTLEWVCYPFPRSCPSPPPWEYWQRYVIARDFLVNPLYFVPSDRGVNILPENTKDALYLQSVGFDYLLKYEETRDPGTTSAQVMIESYQPIEWVESIHPLSGAHNWKSTTFSPSEGGVPQVVDEFPVLDHGPVVVGDRSVLPKALQHPNMGRIYECVSGYWTFDNYEPYTDDICPVPRSGYSTPVADVGMLNAKPSNVGAALNQYWKQKPCCYDVTGDGVPDIAYTTTEWNAYPSDNEGGPHWLDSGVRVFNGATGEEVHYTRVASNEQRFVEEEYFVLGAVGYFIELQALGNATGSAGSDILIHEIIPLENYTRRVRVMDGNTGDIAWTHTGGQNVVALVLGDANRDGGNDVALFDWFNWQWISFTNYDYTNVTATKINVVSGPTGEILWQEETFHAPIDLALMYISFRNWGLPDVNNDGVGDVIVDDPNFLPDLTVIHRQRYLDGADGSTLFPFYNVGTFSLPGYAGDLGGGDGVDDFAIVSGDVMDLWVTVYNGTTGQPDWSRRVLNPRVAGYFLAVPQYVYHPLGTPNGTAAFMNFNLDVSTFGGFRYSNSLYPQTAAFSALGGVRWSYPEFWSDKIFIVVPGSTPASTAFENLLIEESQPTGALGLAVDYGPTSMAAAAMFAAAFGGAFALGNWRYRK